jgi:hypothetical protein
MFVMFASAREIVYNRWRRYSYSLSQILSYIYVNCFNATQIRIILRMESITNFVLRVGTYRAYYFSVIFLNMIHICNFENLANAFVLKWKDLHFKSLQINYQGTF